MGRGEEVEAQGGDPLAKPPPPWDWEERRHRQTDGDGERRTGRAKSPPRSTEFVRAGECAPAHAAQERARLPFSRRGGGGGAQPTARACPFRVDRRVCTWVSPSYGAWGRVSWTSLYQSILVSGMGGDGRVDPLRSREAELSAGRPTLLLISSGTGMEGARKADSGCIHFLGGTSDSGGVASGGESWDMSPPTQPTFPRSGSSGIMALRERGSVPWAAPASGSEGPQADSSSWTPARAEPRLRGCVWIRRCPARRAGQSMPRWSFRCLERLLSVMKPLPQTWQGKGRSVPCSSRWRFR